jgi:hypothetical protein
VSDENKHKPLSSDELIHLLNKKNSKEVDDLDDFEKEALEGFSAIDDPYKAEKLLDDINQSLSKRIGNIEEKKVHRNRVLWFSAAASVVVIFLVTIFFVKESKRDVNSNIALNEPKNEQLIAPGMITPETAVSEKNENKENALAEISQKRFTIPEKNPLEKQEASLKESVVENVPALAQPDKNIVFGATSEESKNRKDEDIKVTENIALEDKVEVRKKEQSAREESEADGYQVAHNSFSTDVANDEQKEASKKADVDYEYSQQRKSVKSKSNDVVTTTAGVVSKSSPAPSVQANEEHAFYPGGESAIKEFVKSFLIAEKNSTVLVGQYKIKGIVSEHGTLKVKSMVQISKDVCNCKDEIEKALNKMNNWHSASDNGKKKASEVEFELIF